LEEQITNLVYHVMHSSHMNYKFLFDLFSIVYLEIVKEFI